MRCAWVSVMLWPAASLVMVPLTAWDVRVWSAPALPTQCQRLLAADPARAASATPDHRHAVGAVEDVVRGLKADGEHRPVGFHFIAGAITQGERLVVLPSCR